MDAASSEEGYKPPPEFQKDAKEPLVDISLTDSTELWLIQWPLNQPPEFDGQELSVKLNAEGELGSFEVLSGKQYNVVSYAAQEPDATVFMSSASESKIVGKISRRVSLVHYPNPNELEKVDNKNLKGMYQRSSGTTLTNSSHHFATTTQNTKLRNSWSPSKHTVSTNSSRDKSSLSEVGEPSKPAKRRNISESAGSMDQSSHGSRRDHSAATSSGSVERSHQGKSKKTKKMSESVFL